MRISTDLDRIPQLQVASAGAAERSSDEIIPHQMTNEAQEAIGDSDSSVVRHSSRPIGNETHSGADDNTIRAPADARKNDISLATTEIHSDEYSSTPALNQTTISEATVSPAVLTRQQLTKKKMAAAKLATRTNTTTSASTSATDVTRKELARKKIAAAKLTTTRTNTTLVRINVTQSTKSHLSGTRKYNNSNNKTKVSRDQVYLASEARRIVNRLRNAKSNMQSTEITSTLSSRTVPPLRSLIRDKYEAVVGDPQFLLDFAIIGLPKCGTSTMSKWIGLHPETLMSNNEMFQLSEGRPAGAVKHLYLLLKRSNGTHYKQGYKSPYDISNKGNALGFIRQYFPKTRLIAGVRHPIKWLESFVNFRIQNGAQFPSLDVLTQTCFTLLCTKTTNFHVFLAGLGKTNETALKGLDMNRMYALVAGAKVPPPLPNKIFLYDMDQLADQNKTRRTQFGKDLQHYLGLHEPMPDMVHENKGQVRNTTNTKQQGIDICDERHKNVRRELLKSGREASAWIRTYFLDAKDVHVSSREYLEEILASWALDPCVDGK